MLTEAVLAFSAQASLYLHTNHAEQSNLLELLVEVGVEAEPTLPALARDVDNSLLWPVYFIIIRNLQGCRHEVTLSPWTGEQEKTKCSENHVRWINEEQVMKGLWGIQKHRKPNKEQPRVGFNWKEASSHLGRSGASGFDDGVSNCQHYILMVTR